MMVVERATFIAKDGKKFEFKYIEAHRKIVVFLNNRRHLTITNVDPENAMKEMNSFMEIWNEANPYSLPS